MGKLTDLGQLEMAVRKCSELSAEIASAATEAIEELASNMVTMEQVNAAIDSKITNAINASY